jgi:hypothetical protein
VPIPVAPWTWRRALRDFGPRDPGVLCSLLVLATYMDRNGFAWPSQKAWARGARVEVRSVQRHLQIAVAAGWVRIENAGRSGQGWRRNAYRCTVPDALPLDDKDEEISTAITAEFGEVDSVEDGDARVVSSDAKGHAGNGR